MGFLMKKADNSFMIKKTNTNIYIADKYDLCDSSVLFIRESPTILYHICDREKGSFKTERYLVGKVGWDCTLGVYYCTRSSCFKRLELIDVWSDIELTGYEGKA